MLNRYYDEAFYEEKKYRKKVYRLDVGNVGGSRERELCQAHGISNLEVFNIQFFMEVVGDSLSCMLNGKVPIIPNRFSKGGGNIWESYFDPFSLLGTVENECPDLLGNPNNPRKILFNRYLRCHKADIHFYHYVCSKYIRINYNTKHYINEEKKRLFPNGQAKVLGILARGTDYIKLKPKRHPIQPSPDYLIKKAKKVMNKFDYKYIYLATEDKRIADAFKKNFDAGIIIENKRHYYDDAYLTQSAFLLAETNLGENIDERTLGLEYLSSLYLLVECDSFIGGDCNGSRFVKLQNNNRFRYCKIFHKGYYRGQDIRTYQFQKGACEALNRSGEIEDAIDE